MAVTRKIYHKERGMGDEDYIFLDCEPSTHTYSVRKGYSYKKPGVLEWEGEEKTYSLSEFQREFP